MKITAAELPGYMKEYNYDKIVVEVVNVEIPEMKKLYQKPKTLAKRLIVTEASTQKFYISTNATVILINYAMYNSFKKGHSYIPNDFELIILTDAAGENILREYEESVGGLEKKFRETFAQVNNEIKAKVEAAAGLLKEARIISDQNGIPFSARGKIPGGVTYYIPESYEQMYADLDPDIMNELTGAYGEGTGWLNSSSNC
jgi:hypothetical protein